MTDSTEPDPPADGVTFRGPANWFSFDIPDRLHVEQSEAFLEIKPTAAVGEVDQSTWSLTLYAAWIDGDDPQRNAASFDAASLFPSVIQSDVGEPLRLPGRCRTWRGISKNTTAATWWKRLLSPKKNYEWQLWVVEFREVMIVSSLQTRSGYGLDEQTVKDCEALLNSILFVEEFAKPPALFREDVLSLAREKFPLLTIESEGSFSISVEGSEINLANFYRSYIHAPEQLKNIVLPGVAAVVRLQELSPEQLIPELAEVADRIMPMLYPDSKADSNETMSDFVQTPWVGGLRIMFVIDEAESYRFVHNHMLRTWEVDADDLRELAMDNLQSFADEHPLEVSVVGEEDDARMLVPVNPNPYNSVRLLGEQLHGRLRQVLGAELVVGVPNRDFFVAVSLNHPELIGQIQQRVVQDYQSMHHPLTNRLLVISADGVSEYLES